MGILAVLCFDPLFVPQPGLSNFRIDTDILPTRNHRLFLH